MGKVLVKADTMSVGNVDQFISRWKASGGNEMANPQSFASELVQILEVEPIKVADAEGQNNNYRFERPVNIFHTGRARRGRIDLYRKGSFIPEAKQGADRKAPDIRQGSLLDENITTKQQGHGKRNTACLDATTGAMCRSLSDV